jgi:hypothetical protein
LILIPTLAVLKTNDWLASTVNPETISHPKIPVATAIEVQYVYYFEAKSF